MGKNIHDIMKEKEFQKTKPMKGRKDEGSIPKSETKVVYEGSTPTQHIHKKKL